MSSLLLTLFFSIFFTTSQLGISAESIVETTYQKSGCSTHPASAYNQTCHSKLKPIAIRKCVAKGFSQSEEIEGSYEFDSGTGGACSTTAGNFISFACTALFKCSSYQDVVSDSESSSVFPQIEYFPHNSPSISEYVFGKSQVETSLKKVLDAGFIVKATFIPVGISPKPMSGGAVVVSKGKMYVSISATSSEIEAGLLSFFSIPSSYGKITFSSHNNPNIAEFLLIKERVENVLLRFEKNGLILKLPEKLVVWIVRKIERDVFETPDRLFVSVSTSGEALERYFMKFVLN